MKSYKQIQGVPNAYLAIDGIEGGFGYTIPLWKYRFLY